MQYLINTGAIPAYDLTTTISPTTIAGLTQQLSPEPIPARWAMPW